MYVFSRRAYALSLAPERLMDCPVRLAHMGSMMIYCWHAGVTAGGCDQALLSTFLIDTKRHYDSSTC